MLTGVFPGMDEEKETRPPASAVRYMVPSRGRRIVREICTCLGIGPEFLRVSQSVSEHGKGIEIKEELQL